LAREQVGQKRLEPKRALIFVTMDRFQHGAAGGDGGPRGTKVQFQLAAIRAFERDGERAVERQPAAIAKRGLDETNLAPASRANETVGGSRPLFAADRAHVGIDERQRGVQPRSCPDTPDHGPRIKRLRARAKWEVAQTVPDLSGYRRLSACERGMV